MKCKIVRFEKLKCAIFMNSTKKKRSYIYNKGWQNMPKPINPSKPIH